jgi:hypothetical protein
MELRYKTPIYYNYYPRYNKKRLRLYIMYINIYIYVYMYIYIYIYSVNNAAKI